MEEEQGHGRALPVPSPLSTCSSSCEAGPSSSSSLPSSRLYEESETTTVEAQVQQPDDDTTDRHPDQNGSFFRYRRHFFRQDFRRNGSSRFNITISSLAAGGIRDDVYSCLAVLATFWFFAVAMILILGFYGSLSLQLGPNCSRLITANEVFVQSIQVQQIEGIEGPMLYGFPSTPALDVETTWTETHNSSIQPSFHKEWIYFLNTGSKLDISYDMKNLSSSPLLLVIAQGKESLIEWMEDPSYPNTTLSWNIIYGSGRIEQEITNSATYYIAVSNKNSEALEVQLNFTIKALLYNITEAYFRCSLYNKVCSFSLMFLKENAAILASPGPEQVKNDDGWYIRLSYGPRWLTYIMGSGILTIVVILLFRSCNICQPRHGDGTATQGGTAADNHEPLLFPKDDDLSSWGSSYDSLSTDEKDLEERLTKEGEQSKEGENNSNPRKLCVVCFDSPRDCFLLPCGHCETCFTCGSRIAEEVGTCPTCQRKMKKVRKIISV